MTLQPNESSNLTQAKRLIVENRNEDGSYDMEGIARDIEQLIDYHTKSNKILCGNAGNGIYLTFKGGCHEELTYNECYRCTGCGGRFHKDCIMEHFKLESNHDWGRQQERDKLKDGIQKLLPNIDEYECSDCQWTGGKHSMGCCGVDSNYWKLVKALKAMLEIL